jgi:hypothetical protein
VTTTHWRKAREIYLCGESANVHADVPGLAESTKEGKETGEERDRILQGHTDLIGDLARIASVREQRSGKLEGRQGRTAAHPGEAGARLTSARYHD